MPAWDLGKRMSREHPPSTSTTSIYPSSPLPLVPLCACVPLPTCQPSDMAWRNKPLATLISLHPLLWTVRLVSDSSAAITCPQALQRQAGVRVEPPRQQPWRLHERDTPRTPQKFLQTRLSHVATLQKRCQAILKASCLACAEVARSTVALTSLPSEKSDILAPPLALPTAYTRRNPTRQCK